MNVVALIRRVLRSSKYWTKGAHARDASGNPCHPCSKAAVCWDIQGALEKVKAPLPAKSQVEEALRKFAKVPLTTYNDNCSWSQLQGLMDRAESLTL